MDLDLEMELEAILNRRRRVDPSWIEYDDAPDIKRLCPGDEIALTKNNSDSDAQVQPTCEAKMDIDFHNGTKVNKTEDDSVANLYGQEQQSNITVTADNNKFQNNGVSSENTVQIFPQTVPLYVNQSHASDFGYCDRSTFSRHLFF